MLELYLELGKASQAVPLLEQQLHDAPEGAARLDVLCQLVSLQVSTGGCMLCSGGPGYLRVLCPGMLWATSQSHSSCWLRSRSQQLWRCSAGLLAIRCMPQSSLF